MKIWDYKKRVNSLKNIKVRSLYPVVQPEAPPGWACFSGPVKSDIGSKGYPSDGTMPVCYTESGKSKNGGKTGSLKME